jgi:uncharacterized membrane protein YesL
MLSGNNSIFTLIYTVTISWLGIPITVNTSELFGPVYGMQIASGNVSGEVFTSGSATLSQLMNVFGTTVDVPAYGTLFFAVIGALILFSAVTWGWQNVGATCLTRNLFRGDAVFVISDFLHGVKKNLRQGFIYGILDLAFLAVLIFNLCFFISTPAASFLDDLIFFITIGLMMLYLCMRKYVYLMLVTFDITIFKALKNALIFSTLGLKRNIMCGLGKAIIVGVNLFLIIWLLPYNIAVPIILPLVYYFATASYISAYAHYPVIEKYMITPYAKPQSATDIEEDDGDTPEE